MKRDKKMEKKKKKTGPLKLMHVESGPKVLIKKKTIIHLSALFQEGPPIMHYTLSPCTLSLKEVLDNKTLTFGPDSIDPYYNIILLWKTLGGSACTVTRPEQTLS